MQYRTLVLKLHGRGNDICVGTAKPYLSLLWFQTGHNIQLEKSLVPSVKHPWESLLDSNHHQWDAMLERWELLMVLPMEMVIMGVLAPQTLMVSCLVEIFHQNIERNQRPRIPSKE